ncbi:hypothetical protein JR316_0007395 [Psilocybe cubensis]|uniref:Uncharacterized protein n=1 Tax=Psilocybe cubensis TaxID=181762 RepID=A0ACB8GZ88_PSICU|nr:hypothetical protein JR316_0007395 [Psilocybe cubensis]KAH9480795.1 hypothetical protein JR316_0007395 [Psilocybe cubensis]
MWNGAKNVLVQGGTFVAKTVFFPNLTPTFSLTDLSTQLDPTCPGPKRDIKHKCVIAAVVLCAAASFNLTLKEYNVSSSSAHILSLPPAVEIYGRDQLVKDAVDKILSQFKDKLKVKRHISIKGGPGMGKTTIAIGIIHDSLVIKYFQDARHWVSCREASKVEDTMKASKLLEYISDSLGLELTASNDRRKDIKYFLEASNHIPRILVLDNFETMWEPHGVQQAVEDILKFLSQFTQLTIVLTTRNAYDPVTHLGVSWHQFDAIEPLTLEASKQLFTSLAPSRSIDDRLEDLLRAVDCIPLPIVLMASSAQESYTTSRILEIWNRGLMAQYNFTSSLGVHDGDPMDVLDRWIEMSLEGPLIKSRPNAITLLRMIAALPSGIRHESLWDISRIQDVDRVAAVLVRTSLITNSPFILQMHSTIRSYMLRNHALSGKYRAQIKEFYFQLIHAAGAEPGAKDFLSHARRLSDEQINAEAILSDALEHDFEPAIWIAMDYCNYLIWNTPSTDIAEKSVQILRNKLLGINKFTQQLDHDNESPFSVEMVNHIYPLALLRLGVLYFRLDNYPEAINALEEAANMGRSLEQTRWTSQAEIYLAEIYRLRGDHTRALGLYSSAYNRSEENFRERASAQRGMAIVHFQDNSFSEALRALETVRDSCPAEDHSCRADCDRELGRLYRNRNQSESIRYSSNARAYYLVHGPRREAAIALYQKSIALYLQGDYDAAETGLKEAFEEFKPLRNDAQMGFCVFHLAEMNRVRGTLNQALALFQRSEMMFEHMENKFMVGLSLKGQAETQARLCRSKEASKASKRAHHLLRTIDAKEATSAVIDTGDLWSMCQWEYAVRENCNMLMLPISCLAVLLIFYYVFIRK